ncbi:S24 family peptidase [Natronolimnohabitans sp. A-GB9]|uniref:S26 family signal peptidase n=1 Tax=Natronolimnohabitans sp. A-GB9 TaxID=3069757 RepID=UPI0027B486FD|nr:S26 family signal peptidase [Natronolimnohabitans sp. A-GB9]MDQ2051187.1 S24 family peptidase [Natronolimnohabitans sp. A-GB9]
MNRSVVVFLSAFLVVVGLLYGLSLAVAVHEVPTDSMEPTIEQDSSIVVLDWGDHDDLEDGEVIVFRVDGDDSDQLVVHRTVTYVDEGDNWVDDLEDDSLTCETAVHCPAPNEGYITKGDANPSYDQETGLTRPVEPDWIEGTYWRSVGV